MARDGAAAESRALRIARGSVAREQVVALARDLILEGEAYGDVAALNGNVVIDGPVGGSVIVLGGSARLAAGARVERDVFVLGGEIETEDGAQIGGRSVAYPTLSSAWLTLLEGPSLGARPWSPTVLAAKLALLAGWLALSVLLLAVSGRQVLATSDAVRVEPFRNFFTGVTGVFALFLTALFFSAFTGSLIGVPLLVLVVLMALLLKLWGTVAVFHALGHWLGVRLFKRRLLPLNAASLGLALLGVVKCLPWIGTPVWWLVSFVGIGVSLSTKFGREEPWFAAPQTTSALS